VVGCLLAGLKGRVCFDGRGPEARTLGRSRDRRLQHAGWSMVQVQLVYPVCKQAIGLVERRPGGLAAPKPT
jgi:hypothetical protein